MASRKWWSGLRGQQSLQVPSAPWPTLAHTREQGTPELQPIRPGSLGEMEASGETEAQAGPAEVGQLRPALACHQACGRDWLWVKGATGCESRGPYSGS